MESLRATPRWTTSTRPPRPRRPGARPPRRSSTSASACTTSRAAKIHRLLEQRPLTAHEIAQRLWGNVALTQAYLTLSEVLGHLDLLAERGRGRRGGRRRRHPLPRGLTAPDLHRRRPCDAARRPRRSACGDRTAVRAATPSPPSRPGPGHRASTHPAADRLGIPAIGVRMRDVGQGQGFPAAPSPPSAAADPDARPGEPPLGPGDRVRSGTSSPPSPAKAFLFVVVAPAARASRAQIAEGTRPRELKNAARAQRALSSLSPRGFPRAAASRRNATSPGADGRSLRSVPARRGAAR